MLQTSPLHSVLEEGTLPAPPTSVAGALQQIAGEAAVIFTGSVVSVVADGAGGAAVRFAVERGIRGAFAGAGYTMRVSAWAGGAQRYYVGERALFLLTAPGVSGYSAPVAGERGIVPLCGDELVGNLDLRWIAEDVQRGTSVPQGNDADGAAVHAAAIAAAPAMASASVEPEGNARMLPDVRAIDRDLVLDLLRSNTAAGQTR